MAGNTSPARDLSSLNYSAKLLVRQDNCVACNGGERLVCPACPAGQVCGFTTQSCTECPKAFCDGGSGGSKTNPTTKSHDGPSAGPIAGGVVGGIIVIVLITYLVWRFLIKPKRASRLDDRHTSIYEADSTPARGVEKNSQAGLGRRASTHTVHSIASTVLTRASNIIQIAYIPGVTNRATPTSPDVLVPPVPPIPVNHTEAANGSEHFFVPGNLRDSTYSGFSTTSDRTSYAPRSSIASTIYGRQAEVQTASQAGMRAKPTVVSVKPGINAPPVPVIDMERFAPPNRPDSTVSTFSVGATYTATQGRAQVVKVGGLKKIDLGAKQEVSSISAASSSNSLGSSNVSSEDVGTIHIAQEVVPRVKSPFADPPSNTSKAANLAAISEEKGDGDAHKTSKTDGPFGDEHATKE
ncbi:Membrane anchor Opy2 [Cordyceps fumosorosea ARSEF 2679]|uniref:Membrane anchor Opy2 n=1 Tax=Cordyceps fumosorosea (strain ARSEF 2679) TaxID=1081104 RepID=A0A167NBZ3_CORFA|nr:Membrane anchor Opy2 [Cordyceps fumosorosea ARSEF 2679]OAA55374.1 Membrane anchor Opy2 [Cordyceps fumosorosea ARSEF 2679]